MAGSAANGNSLAVHGHISYLEIPCIDAPKSVAFYATLFHWKFRNPAATSPSFDDGTGQIIGRLSPNRAPSREPGFLPYIYVTNIHDIIAKTPAAGGTILDPVRPEGDLLLARLHDPAGNVVGIWQFAAT